MKKFLIIISIIFLCGCSRKGPDDVVNEFLNAYKKHDVYGMIDTLEPTVADGLKATFSLIGNAVDIDAEDFLKSSSMFYSLEKGDYDFDYKIIEVEENGETASVVVELDETGEQTTFELIKVDNDWYMEF